jgi:hypothetical protein
LLQLLAGYLVLGPCGCLPFYVKGHFSEDRYRQVVR